MSVKIGSEGARRELSDRSRRFEQLTLEILWRAASVALATAARLAPGKLGKTLHVRRMGDWRVRLASSSKVARFQEHGTRPHEIRAKRGGTLAFRVNGSMRFARVVRHPGNKAVGFLSKGAEAGRTELQNLTRDLFSRL